MEMTLDRTNHAQNLRRYDDDFGYARLSQMARMKCGRRREMIDTDLTGRGVIKARAFSAAEAANIAAKIPADRSTYYDRELIAGLLPKIFNPEVDRHILSYFQSEYAPIGADLYRDTTATPPCESDGWHCDGGPSRHLVMMIYLTPTSVHGGRTIFGDRKLTDALKDVGYINCQLNQRLVDLAPLTNAMQVPTVEPFSFDLDAGEMILFDAPNVVHKRQLPTSGDRLLLVLALIPSMQPWQKAVESGDLPRSIAAEQNMTFPPLPGLSRFA